MTPHQKNRLSDYLAGTTLPLSVAMQRLDIEEGLSIARAELSDVITPCRTCSRWTDADVITDGRCMGCDSVLNPENQQRSE